MKTAEKIAAEIRTDLCKKLGGPLPARSHHSKYIGALIDVIAERLAKLEEKEPKK